MRQVGWLGHFEGESDAPRDVRKAGALFWPRLGLAGTRRGCRQPDVSKQPQQVATTLSSTLPRETLAFFNLLSYLTCEL